MNILLDLRIIDSGSHATPEGKALLFLSTFFQPLDLYPRGVLVSDIRTYLALALGSPSLLYSNSPFKYEDPYNRTHWPRVFNE